MQTSEFSSGRFRAPEISTTSEEEDFNPMTTEEWRWMSPELMTDCLDDEQCTPHVTMATDVWSFAMTVVEVSTFVHSERKAASQKARPRRFHFSAYYCNLSPVIITYIL